MPKISVIVPVYNTEKYIKKCIMSILKQTMQDIEIIIVNDNSDEKNSKILSKSASEMIDLFIIVKSN